MSTIRLGIFGFRRFHKHRVFILDGEKIRDKELRKYFDVSVVIDIERGNIVD